MNAQFCIVKMRILKMILNKTIKKFTVSVITVMVSSILFSSCKNKTNDYYLVKNVQEELENQDKKIAKFLVETTKINIQIVKLTKEVKDNSASKEIKELLNNQEASIFRIQNEITKISENKLITLPIFSSVIITKNKEVIKDSQFIDELINLLVTEVILFEKIKIDLTDKTMLAFQEQYKPILDKNLEEISALKVQNFLNN